MEDLLKGLKRRRDEDEPAYENDSDSDGQDEPAHQELLESLGKTVGAKLNRRTSARRRAETRISEYDTLPADDRGPLPAFRGVKELRQAKPKRKGKTGELEVVDEQDLLDEVHDDSSVTLPVAAKQKRAALYENTKKEISQWNAVVYDNRSAEQVVYPLGAGEKLFKRTMKDAADEFVPQTPLEEEMAKILHGEDYVKRKKDQMHTVKTLTADESYQLAVEEALGQHNDMARLRALQSYEIAKARRRNKIKSKKYHRLLRREKIKKQMEEFEQLKQTNPELALEKLEELENARIKERMTLKHKNTTKWSKMHAARAKYSKESRIALSEQLKISKDLTAKSADSSDESSDLDEDGDEDIAEKPQKEGDAYEVRDLQVNAEDVLSEICLGPRPNRKPVLNLLAARSSATPAAPLSKPAARPNPAVIDPKKYVQISHKDAAAKAKEITIDSELMDEAEDDDEEGEMEDGDDDDQRMIIAEAFEDDDVVSEFKQKKTDEVDAGKPKDVNLFLPGWGQWGGKALAPSKKKVGRFIKKAPPQAPRKDEYLGHVIINEKANEKIRQHMVKHLPYPFKRVQDFEKIIRAPVGRTWLPERATKTLTKPKVITRLGSVIKPISEDVLIKQKTDTDDGKKAPVLKLLRV